MATIEKRGKAYRITVSAGLDLDGKQIRHRMTWTPDPKLTPRQVEKELTRQAVHFEEQVKNGGSSIDSSIRFADFAAKYMEEYGKQNLKPTTLDNYTRNLERINQAMGHIRLRDLKPLHIQAFLNNLQEEGIRTHKTAKGRPALARWVKGTGQSLTELGREAKISRQTLTAALHGDTVAYASAAKIAELAGMEVPELFEVQDDVRPLAPATIHAYHRTLSSVLDRAVVWRIIPSNPAERAALPSLAGRRAKYLDEPDAKRMLELLQAEPYPWRALIIFDLLSGLRRAELLGLRWEDLDPDGQTLRIVRTSNYTPGKGVYLSTPKTEGSERVLKISKTAVLILLEYRRWQNSRREQLGDAWEGDPADDRIFTNDTGKPVFPTSPTAWMRDFARRTGLPASTIHSLRHTYASLLISDGTPLVVVAGNLGHAQTSTTANIYAHVIASAEAKAATVLDKFAGDINPKLTPSQEEDNIPEKTKKP